MKKLFMSSLVLFFFAVSIFTFQLACKKELRADLPPLPSTQLNKLIYVVNGYPNYEVWTSYYDGSGAKNLNVQFPGNKSNYEIDGFHFSPDGKKIFASLYDLTTKRSSIYSWDGDGTNMKKVVDNGMMVSVH
ncbi:hypothetical protein [Pedobacter sp. BMA]|uniref:hypothetical protein n=1 Tax=Pedobacter sp. BMA TaxID=1663685 RepID=UPI0012E0A330|nr:hypothetical protein [Pedobacter sp. BMA]